MVVSFGLKKRRCSEPPYVVHSGTLGVAVAVAVGVAVLVGVFVTVGVDVAVGSTVAVAVG